MFFSKLQLAEAIHPPPKEVGVFSPVLDKRDFRGSTLVNLDCVKNFLYSLIEEATKMLVSDIRDDHEIIEGVKIMAPSPFKRHGKVVSRLMFTIGTHAFINKLGSAFSDNFDVNLPDGNTLRPDFIFIGSANDSIVFNNEDENFYGVPDMVVEIFSRSTMKRDMTVKKDIYERNGVKEYWLINPWSESIEVYLLRDGKYFLDNVYQNYSDNDLKNMTDEERTEVKFEIPVAVLDGFKIKIKNIFGWYFE